MKRLSIFAIIVAFVSAMNLGCAARLPLKDEAGRPITKTEVDAKKGNSNFVLFTIGGGALSFGASFFVGSLLDRNSTEKDQTLLWTTAGVGTLAGIIYFAHQGRVRDYNLAVEVVKEERRQGVAKELKGEKERRLQIEAEKERLQKEREQQETERKRLLEQINKKKNNDGK